jgi:hypothetical protein
VVATFVVVGLYSVMPPAAVSSDEPATAFSAARALAHIEVIAREPHPMGSTAIAAVRDYLVAELEELGLEPEFQTIPAPNYYESGGLVDVVNVIATIPGTANTGAIALMAHYDTVPATPGANDNTSGVATILEAARAILAGSHLRNDVILLFTDGEEPAPRPGSRGFVAESPVFGDIAIVVNLETNGGSGPSMLVETSEPAAWLVENYAEGVSNPTAYSFITTTSALIGDVGTDFGPFRNAGVPGFHFAYMRGSPIYHSPADNIGSVSWDSVQHHGSNALGIVRHFGDLDLGVMPESGESVYFTVRPFFVHYPASWSIPVALLAAVLLLVGFVRETRRNGRRMGSIILSGAIALLMTLAATLIATLVWLLVTAISSTPSVPESYLYFYVAFGLGASLTLWLSRRVPIKRGMAGPGFLLVWIALALLTAIAAPGFSPLFTLPALAGAVAYNWHTRPTDWGAVLRFALVAAPTVVLLIPAVDFYFQFGQPRPGNPDSSVPSVAAVAFLLAFLGGGLLLTVWRSPRASSDASPLPASSNTPLTPSAS